ncbi:peptidoglycan D,D-transpeptidase FtsI family protein [uncultured Ruthenibacterium sp.]|uniref:peptidoglycan D,D-transpeptidase FtsI family protein n=1 Tax=uncultured Ruthenibacterium sp. TaxID=1905347 RepID=UPI00349EA76F
MFVTTGRLVTFFCGFILAFTILAANLALLCTNEQYAQAASDQTQTTLTLYNGRGNIYDCNFVPLTNVFVQTYAAVEPGGTSYHALFESIPETQKSLFYSRIQMGTPFLIEVEPQGQTQPEYLFSSPVRYYPNPTAVHLIGYLDSEGHGVSGAEYAYDDLLTQASTSTRVLCTTTAVGEFLESAPPKMLYTQGSGAGIMLTIDETIQRICEGVAQQMMKKGSIVVLETATGRVRASVSVPTYDPDDVATSISRNDSSLINRSISAFNVGSVFKPILAAAAIEAGLDTSAVYECTGSTEIGGHVYRCAYGKGHGKVNLKQALEQSCNCYFIHLGLQLGAEKVEQAARLCGYGTETCYMGTLTTAKGNLPDAQQLENLGQLASISFGQGALTATPIQVAASINVFANQGRYIEPTFVEGIVNEYSQTVTQSLYSPIQRQAFRPDTAETIREMLVSVVENGLGSPAQPLHGGAGGKTGTAQTGRFQEDGEEIMDAWFAGFYPAENPQYTIAVLLDSGTYSSDDAAEIFGKVATDLGMYLGVQDEY